MTTFLSCFSIGSFIICIFFLSILQVLKYYYSGDDAIVASLVCSGISAQRKSFSNVPNGQKKLSERRIAFDFVILKQSFLAAQNSEILLPSETGDLLNWSENPSKRV